ncbi:hypothetical protein U8P76_10790 [Rhizobium johnstonii]|nr:hypothetical protein [Rhizobium leguminosarum]WSG97236.1 hypothetical protein U8P76_10790 [Rhizobium johnstonii]
MSWLAAIWRRLTGRSVTFTVIDFDWQNLPEEEVERLVRKHKRRIKI